MSWKEKWRAAQQEAQERFTQVARIERQVFNPLGMSQDPMRHIAYTQSGAWWDDRDMAHMKDTDHDIICVSQDATDDDIDSLIRFRLMRG